MGQRDKGVVVGLGAGAPPIQFGIDHRRRAEQGESLVDEVTAEVVEQSAGLSWLGRLAPASGEIRPPTLETRLEPSAGAREPRPRSSQAACRRQHRRRPRSPRERAAHARGSGPPRRRDRSNRPASRPSRANQAERRRDGRFGHASAVRRLESRSRRARGRRPPRSAARGRPHRPSRSRAVRRGRAGSQPPVKAGANSARAAGPRNCRGSRPRPGREQQRHSPASDGDRRSSQPASPSQ